MEALSSAKRDALKLILLTAQRPGEVVGIRAREVDLEKGLWVIPADRSKNKREHVVPLVGEARAIISRLVAGARKDDLSRHDDRLLLVRQRGVRPLQVNNLNWSLRSALGAAGVAVAKPHDLRRTALSHLARLGFDPLVIGHVANHVSVTKNTVTTAVYVQHDYLSEKEQALSAWSWNLSFLLGGEDPPSTANNVVDPVASIAMPPRRRPRSPNDEGMVDVVITRDEHSASAGRGLRSRQYAARHATMN